MEYKRFVLRPFEREPGKWRASIRRADGKPVKVIGGRKLEQSVTHFDAPTADAAIRMAMAAIDAGTFDVTERPQRDSGVVGDSFPESKIERVAHV